MSLIPLVLLLLAVALSTAAVLAALRRQQAAHLTFLKQQADETDDKIQALRTEWGKTLGALTEAQNTTLQESQQNIQGTMGKLQAQLQVFDEQHKYLLEATKDITSLQDLLKPPKLRGGIGEMLLGHLLEQVLPQGFFTEQYRFKDGRQVDAVIHVGERLVCVDAKFPLEHFRLLQQAQGEEAQRRARRDFLAGVKKHVNDIAEKYILPDEGTYDFALMYIPAENVYYELIIKDEAAGERTGLFEHSLQRKVIPVSPNNFYAYLQVILMGLKGLTIERSAQQVLQHLAGLRTDLDRLQGDVVKTGNHLRDAQGSCEASLKRLAGVQEQVRQMESPVLPALGAAAARLPEPLEAAP